MISAAIYNIFIYKYFLPRVFDFLLRIKTKSIENLLLKFFYLLTNSNHFYRKKTDKKIDFAEARELMEREIASNTVKEMQ